MIKSDERWASSIVAINQAFAVREAELIARIASLEAQVDAQAQELGCKAETVADGDVNVNASLIAEVEALGADCRRSAAALAAALEETARLRREAVSVAEHHAQEVQRVTDEQRRMMEAEVSLAVRNGERELSSLLETHEQAQAQHQARYYDLQRINADLSARLADETERNRTAAEAHARASDELKTKWHESNVEMLEKEAEFMNALACIQQFSIPTSGGVAEGFVVPRLRSAAANRSVDTIMKELEKLRRASRELDEIRSSAFWNRLFASKSKPQGGQWT
jgi:hypothetical protein